MALSARNRTILYEHFTQTIQDPEAVEQMLSYFPARDAEEPLTREYLDARLAEAQLAIETNLDRRMEERFAMQWAVIEARFDQVDARFAQIDARFAQIDKRLDQMDQRHEALLRTLDGRFDQVDGRFGRLEDRVTKVEERLTSLEVAMADGFRKMQQWIVGTGLAVAGTVVAAAGLAVGAGLLPG